MKNVRFIHTADIHLDTGFSGAGFPSRLGDRKREAIRGTFRRIFDDAKAREADFVLIAGDLFESTQATPDTIEFLKQRLSELSPARVFISPGNHDPFIKGSPYKEEIWPDNVHIFNSSEFQSVDLPELGVCVTGLGFTLPYMEDRLFQTLPVLKKDMFNIVLAHGSDVSGVPEGKAAYGPFEVAEIAGKNVNYCALGHYHSQRRLKSDNAEIWYAGIPEGRGWDEEGVRGYLFCQIDENAVNVERVVCSRFNLHTITVNCESFSTREQILDAILKHQEARPENILRIRLVGTMDPRLDLSFSELEERLSGTCLFVRWEDETQPALDFDAIAKEKTLRGNFARVLNERVASAGENERKVLERARLYGIEALSGQEVRLR